jgi:hypothetical protein
LELAYVERALLPAAFDVVFDVDREAHGFKSRALSEAEGCRKDAITTNRRLQPLSEPACAEPKSCQAQNINSYP